MWRIIISLLSLVRYSFWANYVLHIISFYSFYQYFIHIRLSSRSSSVAHFTLVPVSGPAVLEVDFGTLSLANPWPEIVFDSIPIGELPRPEKGEVFEGGGGGVLDGGLWSFAARSGISISAVLVWTDAGAASVDADFAEDLDVGEDLLSELLGLDKICSLWYSANSFRMASTLAETAADSESAFPFVGEGRPLGKTGE